MVQSDESKNKEEKERKEEGEGADTGRWLAQVSVKEVAGTAMWQKHDALVRPQRLRVTQPWGEGGACIRAMV